VIAPVVNYRPAHFHDLAPGAVMEFHFDLAQVLKAISTSQRLCISYGSEWKPFALPYMYLTCREYKEEVRRLCPNETPNGKSDAMYEDDVVKDVTKLILAVPELDVFKRKSFVAAMKSRTNLYPMYAVFASLFSEVSNYQIQIRDLTSVPPRFILKTSKSALDSSKQPIVIAGSSDIWPLLPTIQSHAQHVDTQVPVAAKPQAYINSDDDDDDNAAAVQGSSIGGWNNTATFVGVAAIATCIAAVAVALLPTKRHR
jgi:hypothetical protein